MFDQDIEEQYKKGIEMDNNTSDLRKLLKLSEEFIKSNGLIIYGGLAIDYSIKKSGGIGIYKDYELPDYDCLSYDNVNISYDAVDFFRSKGYEVNSIRALHVQTMRIQYNFNILIDITYCHKTIYDKINTLEYNGFKIVEPIYQKLEIHNALSYPYKNPGHEEIFNRFEKDILRYNLIDEYYPPEKSLIKKEDIKYKEIEFPNIQNVVFGGFAAFALINDILKFNGFETDYLLTKKNNKLYLKLPETFDIEVYSYVNMTDILEYKKYGKKNKSIDILPDGDVFELDDNTKLIVYDSSGEIITYSNINSIHVTSSQFILKQFLFLYLFRNDKISYYFYLKLLDFINFTSDNYKKFIDTPIFFGLKIYGDDNISDAGLINISNIVKMTKIDIINDTIKNMLIDLSTLPQKYYKTRPDKYEYISDFFKTDGLIIKN